MQVTVAGMAPQTKRAGSNKETRSPAKKTKAEKTVDPLAPILLALAECEKTAASADTLQAALPHCLAAAKEERHGFQTKVIDHALSALSTLQDQARSDLAEAEAAAENFRAKSVEAQADFESKKLVANARKEECESKAGEVKKYQEEVSAITSEVKAEMEKKDAFLASKATLGEAQQAFQKVLDDSWQPLKACSFTPQQWRKRDKACNDLIEKMAPLSLEESLLDALRATLKLKVEQRSAFAQRAIACIEEAFTKHQALLADRVTGAAAEEEALGAAVAAAEEKLCVAKGKLEVQDKEDIDLQNTWVDLENTAQAAKMSAESFDAEAKDALEEVATCKAAVDAATAHSEAFAALCDPPAPQPPAVAGAEAGNAEAAEAEATPMAVEVAAEAVAA